MFTGKRSYGFYGILGRFQASAFSQLNLQQSPYPQTVSSFHRIVHVALWFLPYQKRNAALLIYRFACLVYAQSDANHLPVEQRLQTLEEYKNAIDRMALNTPTEPGFFAQLQDVIKAFNLPLTPFYDLLEAGHQRIHPQRFENFGELINFCRRSANPLSRLMLHVLDAATPRNIGYADALGSALQLIHFLQNVVFDVKKDTLYFPQDEMKKYKITEAQILRGDTSGTWGLFFDFELQRARRLLQSAAPLGLQLKGWAGLEVRMLIAGGERILKKMHQSRGDVFNLRPVLTPRDWVYMIYRAIRAK